jgi:FkbM family methyltransferase
MGEFHVLDADSNELATWQPAPFSTEILCRPRCRFCGGNPRAKTDCPLRFPQSLVGNLRTRRRRVFERTVVKGSVVFDIGANVGFYALLSSVLVGREGRVYAFEPIPQNLSFLKNYLEINRISNVQVIETAVAERSGTARFEENANRSMSHISSDGGVEVKVVSLDELTSSGELTPSNYLKIDVEGAELTVLAGAKATIAKSPPTIMLATHARDIHRQCGDFLSSMGYRVECQADNLKDGPEMRGEPLAHSQRPA